MTTLVPWVVDILPTFISKVTADNWGVSFLITTLTEDKEIWCVARSPEKMTGVLFVGTEKTADFSGSAEQFRAWIEPIITNNHWYFGPLESLPNDPEEESHE